MDERSVGLLLAGLGAAAIVVGLLVYVGAFSWFGRLPGDIRIQGENTRVYIPITSMIVVSIALTVIVNLVRRLF